MVNVKEIIEILEEVPDIDEIENRTSWGQEYESYIIKASGMVCHIALCEKRDRAVIIAPPSFRPHILKKILDIISSDEDTSMMHHGFDLTRNAVFYNGIRVYNGISVQNIATNGSSLDTDWVCGVRNNIGLITHSLKVDGLDVVRDYYTEEEFYFKCKRILVELDQYREGIIVDSPEYKKLLANPRFQEVITTIREYIGCSETFGVVNAKKEAEAWPDGDYSGFNLWFMTQSQQFDPDFERSNNKDRPSGQDQLLNMLKAKNTLQNLYTPVQGKNIEKSALTKRKY